MKTAFIEKIMKILNKRSHRTALFLMDSKIHSSALNHIVKVGVFWCFEK